MLDIKLIREKPDFVRKNLERRQNKEILKWFDDLIKTDREWRTSLKKVEDLRKRRNEITAEIANLKRQSKPVTKQMKEVKEIPDQIKKTETKTEKLKEKINWYLMRLPNMLHNTVPFGKDDTENKVIKKWGKIPKFDFRVRNHQDIAENLGLIDIKRAAKIAGHGFFYLKGDLALLDQAITRFALDHIIKKGYTFIYPPHMMKRNAYEGVTDLNDFENVMYKIENDNLYLIATAEHPVGAMLMNEVQEKKDMPLKFVGFSTNFRREVGAHGKYTRGLFRMHQFNKVEQFIFCHPDDSWKLHEELQKNAEELYQKLELPYRVVNVCTGDIGIIAAKKYDIEMWMADGKYREIGSNSNCTDYQARRLNIKFREKEGRVPIGFVHTLNNTALATSRTMVALLEVHQQKDGTVKIPSALRPYMNGKKFIGK